MIPSSELEAMRAETEAVLLSDSCTLWREVATDDGMGGGTQTLTQVGAFACYVAPHIMRPVQIDRQGLLQTVLRFQVFIPAGTEVLPNDVLIPSNHDVFKVTDHTVESNAVLTSVACERIR